MAVKVVNREQLLYIHEDIQKFKREHPGVSLLKKFSSDIDDFYHGIFSKHRSNAVEIQNTYDKRTRLQERYFEFTDEKEPQIKMIPAVAPKAAVMDGDVVVEPAVEYKEAEPVMQEGKTFEEFNAEYEKIMSENVNVYL